MIRRMVWTAFLFVVGLVGLIVGAEWLVRGASRLAAVAGISPLVIGLTVVAFATSSPELAVSEVAAIKGSADLALGNIVGSNISNILLILGIAASLRPITVHRQLIRMEVPLLIAVSAAILPLASDGMLGRVDGLALLAVLFVYLAWSIKVARRDASAFAQQVEPDAAASKGRVGKQLGLVVVGLVVLLIGSQCLVSSATTMARAFGVSDLVVGLTIVAVGTSLPEIATSVLAVFRGESELAVGNAIGSNLVNLLGVLAATSVVAPGGVVVTPAAMAFDIPVMLAAAIACAPIFFTGLVISRAEGVVFLGYYVAYVAYVTLNAIQHDALPAFSRAMWLFVIPITAVGLVFPIVMRATARARKT